MRLLQIHDDSKFSLVEYLGNNIPRYAILSHTWGSNDDEVTFEDLRRGTAGGKVGYRKLTFCSRQAARDGLEYFWIDTCCIDKSSSAELSESINSMYRWYQNAERCYVYLSDVRYDHSDCAARWERAFAKSRWFTRGWTLQELIAPTSVEFFSTEGHMLCSKRSFQVTLHEITGIATPALQGTALSRFSVLERMSWATKRQTTREEDTAYCLLGIFDIFMPLIYGEGRKNALRRLEEHIKKISKDSILSLDDEQRSKLLKSLWFEQIDARHMTIRRSHSKTCEWLLRTSEYLDWLDEDKVGEHHGFLWIKGKPGTGKSTLMKFTSADAQQSMTTTVVISFFFNARGDTMEKSTIGAYQSLLLQLLERLPALQIVLDSVVTSASSITTKYQWKVETLKTLLEQAIRCLGESSVICFIDALDECEEQQIRDMISFFENIGELAVSSGLRFRVCFSSRHYPHISIKKGTDLVLEGEVGHSQDIANYLDSELKIGQSRTAEQIRAELQEKAAGIFIYVVIVVGILNKDYDSGRLSALRRRLHEIPSNLYELFCNIITRDSENKDELLLCIQWVLFSRRPLKPEELYFAILSGLETELQPEWLPKEVSLDAIRRFILNSSKGLAEITYFPFPRVQFIHESVRDFLLKGDYFNKIWPELSDNFQGRSHERLRSCCWRYVNIDSLSHFDSNHSSLKALERQTWERHMDIADPFPFLTYAIQSMLYHADLAEKCGINQENFLYSFPLAKWAKMRNSLSRYSTSFSGYGERNYTEEVSLLYVLAYHNASNLIRAYPTNRMYLNVEKERYGTPLFAAIANRSVEAVRTFVKVDAMSQPPESWLHNLRSHFSNKEGTTAVFGREFRFTNRRTVLSHLAELGDNAIFALALQKRYIPPDARDEDARTPLTYASIKGCSSIVKLLLETRKVDVNSRDADGCTPLLHSVRRGHAAVVKLLLEAGNANVNTQDNDGRTPLCLASGHGRIEIAQMLHETGKARVDMTDKSGGTPLMYAAATWGGTEAVVKMLLKTNAIDIDMRDVYGRTALSFAAGGSRSEAVVKILLETNKVDVGSKDKDGRTPLSYAASGHGNVTIVRLLLDYGADLNSGDNSGLTPLDWAEMSGYEAVAILLRTRLHVEY